MPWPSWSLHDHQAFNLISTDHSKETQKLHSMRTITRHLVIVSSAFHGVEHNSSFMVSWNP
eukprot:1053416-Pelagomonas_calceolata.AAC.4